MACKYIFGLTQYTGSQIIADFFFYLVGVPLNEAKTSRDYLFLTNGRYTSLTAIIGS